MAAEAEYSIGERVYFASQYLHERMGKRSHELLDSYQDDDGDWWYSIDKRNYFGASYLSAEPPQAEVH